VNKTLRIWAARYLVAALIGTGMPATWAASVTEDTQAQQQELRRAEIQRREAVEREAAANAPAVHTNDAKES
jgi:hypothetical protein